jgi:hypothetical protein
MIGRSKPTRLEAAALVATALTLGATAWHLSHNAAPPYLDDARYLEISSRLWMALQTGPAEFANLYLTALRHKAPLICLMPFPLYSLFGLGERVAIWANLPLAAVSAWAWFKAARLWWWDHPRGREIAAIAGALSALLPISYGLSRLFYTETLVTCLLGLWAWRCAAAQPEGRAEGWRLGILLGLGLLAKVTFPALAAAFAWPARRRLRPHAVTILLVGCALAATWYAKNAPSTFRYAWSAAFGSIGDDFAAGGGVSARAAWILSLLHNGLSWPLAAAGAAAAGIALAAGPGRLDSGTRVAIWGLSPLIISLLSINREIRLSAPMLPVLAALLARLAAAPADARLYALSASLLLAAGTAVCFDQTFRAGPGRALSYNGSPSAAVHWDHRNTLIDMASRVIGRDKVIAMTSPYSQLNTSALTVKAAERGLGLRFVFLGFHPEAALSLLNKEDVTAIMFVNGPTTDILIDGSMLTRMIIGPELEKRAAQTNAYVMAAMKSSLLPAYLAETVALAPGVTATIWVLTRN